MAIISRGAWLAAAIVLCMQPARPQAPPGGSIEGDVVGASSGRGIAGARVRIQSRQDDPLFTTADEQGHFRFAGLALKSYQADASYPGFMSARKAAGVNGGETVSLGTFRPNAEIRLEMQRYGVIAGKVTDPAGVAAEGVTVGALQRFPMGERGHSSLCLGSREGDYQYAGRLCVRTNDLGEYRLGPLAAGSYYIGADPQTNPNSFGLPAMWLPRDASERATFYPHALKPSQTKPVTVDEGKELRVDVQIVREGGVKVSGRVLGLGAGETAGLQVSVYAVPLSANGGQSSDLAIGGDRFQATDLLPGKYLFEAFQWAANPLDFSMVTVAAARRTVEVGTADADGIDLTLAPTLDIEGTVVFENGCAAAPVRIMLRGDFAHARDLHAGTDGRFVLQHLIPENYKVYVQPEAPTNAIASSAKLGDTEVLKDGFEATANTKGPLRITMSCRRR